MKYYVYYGTESNHEMIATCDTQRQAIDEVNNHAGSRRDVELLWFYNKSRWDLVTKTCGETTEVYLARMEDEGY